MLYFNKWQEYQWRIYLGNKGYIFKNFDIDEFIDDLFDKRIIYNWESFRESFEMIVEMLKDSDTYDETMKNVLSHLDVLRFNDIEPWMTLYDVTKILDIIMQEKINKGLITLPKPPEEPIGEQVGDDIEESDREENNMVESDADEPYDDDIPISEPPLAYPVAPPVLKRSFQNEGEEGEKLYG
jgi:hypothetical protein